MNKKLLNLSALKKIIQTTQAIEGYKPATAEVQTPRSLGF